MNKILISIAALFLILTGCKKETTLSPDNHKTLSSGVEYCGTTQQVNLIAGQFTNIGTVTVGNDETNLYVTYQATGSWYFTQLHLFVGDCNNKPVNKQGNPVPGQFPYKTTFSSPYSQQYTFVIPLANLPQCYCVAAHAAVIKKNSNGGVAQSETAWGEGTRFVPKGNWGMYFNDCKDECQPEGEGCGYRAPYWFNGLNAWPGGQVTVAGYTYTQAEGWAIANAYNNGGGSEASFIFMEVASIKLSGSNVGSGASILGDVQLAESYLAGLGKLTPNLVFNGNQSALDAGYAIETWLDYHECQ